MGTSLPCFINMPHLTPIAVFFSTAESGQDDNLRHLMGVSLSSISNYGGGVMIWICLSQ